MMELRSGFLTFFFCLIHRAFVQQCGFDKTHEQGVWVDHCAFVFGMELHAEEPGMFFYLHDLHQSCIGVHTACDQSSLGELVLVGVVVFVAVSMPLIDLFPLVDLSGSFSCNTQS